MFGEIEHEHRPPRSSHQFGFCRLRRVAKVVAHLFVVAFTRSWIAVPLFALLTCVVVDSLFHANNDALGGGEPFGWFDGASAWPAIGIMIFAGLLAFHFIFKSQNDLTENAKSLTNHFGLRDDMHEGKSWLGWETIPWKDHTQHIDMATLWRRYLFRGRLSRRIFRVLPMAFLYIIAVSLVSGLMGGYAKIPIRGTLIFWPFLLLTVVLFVVLTFFVIDATMLHCGFLKQLESAETYWPDDTFRKFGYPVDRAPEKYATELSYFWDVLFISRRTEAIGNLIYYPFIILLCLILARFSCFDNWTWAPGVVVTLFMHFSLALYAAWSVPKAAVAYRDTVLGELNLRRRKALMIEGKTPDAIDTMIDEVQSNHKGAFSYLWEQPAIRALLLPSSGIGLVTLLQYLPH
jgi:hypothetical protein